MIDLHQGMTGEELRELKPGLGSVAMLQLEVMSTLMRGGWKNAARKQAGTWWLLGKRAGGALIPKGERAKDARRDRRQCERDEKDSPLAIHGPPGCELVRAKTAPATSQVISLGYQCTMVRL